MKVLIVRHAQSANNIVQAQVIILSSVSTLCCEERPWSLLPTRDPMFSPVVEAL
jgi:hypothetical protein